MQIKLYFDEDALHRRLKQAMRERGVDILTADEAGMRERDDTDHLDFATAQGRVLYSFNMGDFCGIHTEYIVSDKSHAGIILAPQQRYSVGEQMRRLTRIVNARTAEQMIDQLEFLSNWG
ncbi:MAG: DUF5615 family PIN-like protein [Blastocatellia bacterium]